PGRGRRLLMAWACARCRTRCTTWSGRRSSEAVVDDQVEDLGEDPPQRERPVRHLVHARSLRCALDGVPLRDQVGHDAEVRVGRPAAPRIGFAGRLDAVSVDDLLTVSGWRGRERRRGASDPDEAVTGAFGAADDLVPWHL